MDDPPEIRKELILGQKGVWWSGCINRERKRQSSLLWEYIDIDDIDDFDEFDDFTNRTRPIETIIRVLIQVYNVYIFI